MYLDQKVVVIMPAYNAARTLKKTYDEVMAQGVVDLVIVVDDASRDETVALARTLPHTEVIVHAHNLLEDIPLAASPLIKPIVNRLIGRPGYFRFRSDFSLSVSVDGLTQERHGSTLHEMVALT